MTRMTRAALAAAPLLALALASPAAALQATPHGCPAEAPAQAQPAKPKKKSALGGLLSAAARSGLGEVLIAEAGDEASAQVTAAVIDAARSGDPVGTAADAGASALVRGRDGARNARIAGAVVGTARELRQQRAEACAAVAPQAEPDAQPQDEWN